MEKASKKLGKHDRKTKKKLNKAVRKRYGLTGSVEKYERAREKAERAAYKGNKWYNHMENTFGKQSVVSISDRDKAIGKSFADFFAQKAAFERSTYRNRG